VANSNIATVCTIANPTTSQLLGYGNSTGYYSHSEDSTELQKAKAIVCTGSCFRHASCVPILHHIVEAGN